MTSVGRFVVAADHPSLPGHFPGRPIVPGVVLLDHVLDLILPPGTRVTSLPGVKFLGAVRPGEVVEVAAAAAIGRVRFAATRDGVAVLRGSAELAS